MKWQQYSDEELVQQCRLADTGSRRGIADELFSRHYERVGRWCFRFTGDREAAADTAQEVFTKAYRHLESFQGNARFSTWLYTIARNECLNAIKARGDDLADSGDEMPDEVIDPAVSVPEVLQQQERAQTVKQLLTEALDETERVVFALHYADEMPLDVITRVLSLQNVSGAKAYIVSAKRKLSRAVARLKAKGAV